MIKYFYQIAAVLILGLGFATAGPRAEEDMPARGLQTDQKEKQDFNEERTAVNELIDEYNRTEDILDFEAQAKLMTDDRIFVGPAGEGRTLDQKGHMAHQQRWSVIIKKEVPGIAWWTTARDRVIRFYCNGGMAIASYYLVRWVAIPENTPADVAARYPDPDQYSVTLVLEKIEGAWKIVHTHTSLLHYPTAGTN